MRWSHFSLWILHPRNQMFLMWSACQKKVARLGTILWQSSTLRTYQEQWQGRQLLSPPSPRWNHKSSQSIRIPMNPQFHMGLVTNIQSCHPASIFSTSHRNFSKCWLLWPWFEQTKGTAPNHKPSIPSPISTPPLNVSTIQSSETTHTTTDDAIFYPEDEPSRVFWDISSSKTFDSNEPRHAPIAASQSSTPPPTRQKRKLNMRMSFPKKRGVSQHTCEACG